MNRAAVTARTPIVGRVAAVRAAVGDAVAAGAELGRIESMKMFIPVTAPVAGTITAVTAAPGDVLPGGSPFATIDPARP